MLLSPLDPDRELSIYECNSKIRNYYFCPTCGVRCFTFGSVGEIDVVDFTELGEDKEGKREVWRMKSNGEYISVNATTIDYREDFDLRVLTEEKRVQYFDDRTEPEENRKAPQWDRPHNGGSY
jgi:hypothetical protein